MRQNQTIPFYGPDGSSLGYRIPLAGQSDPQERHYHPRRRRAGWICVIRAEGASKVFVFGKKRPSRPRPSRCAITGAPAREGFAAQQECALTHGQKRHQLSVVLAILGEQSSVISRERLSSKVAPWRPPASKSPRAKSFFPGRNAGK
jgi:hypothetical protein